MSLALISCDKNKKWSKRLAGENWAATALTINGQAEDNLPELHFDECDIYDETCTGEWMLNGSSSAMAWQFREKASVFEISNQSELEQDIDPAILQCMNMSGVYEVLESEKEKIVIRSDATYGYEGKFVEMTLEKQ